MRAPHLHLFGWDTPHCPIKIKLPPLRLPQLTWSDENIWRKPQRRVSCRLPVETINGAEQRTNSHRVNDSGAPGHQFRFRVTRPSRSVTLASPFSVPAHPFCGWTAAKTEFVHGSQQATKTIPIVALTDDMGNTLI
jgi:hypothetical protein